MRALRSCFVPLALALIAATGAACRDSGGDDDGVNPNPDARDGDSSNPDDMKIQEVQDDATPVGTAVTLRGVVVVAIDKYGNRTGNFYVAEAEGGERSGVLVFGAPLAQVDALAVGDLVDITDAEKDEFGQMDDPTGQTVTELKGAGGGMMSVTKVGTGTVPAPHVVDALANGRLPEAMRRVEQEKWEHVLIRVENVTATSGVRHISSTTDDPTFNEFGVTGYYRVDSSLSEVALTPPVVAAGDCLASITGMGDYFYNYKVLPRAVGDIVTNGTGCPAPETTVAECGDTIDNDANGFADCSDRACVAAVPACTASTNVVNVQTGVVPDLTNINLANVVVTGVAFNKKNLWVADGLQAAPNNGVYVFRGTAADVLPDTVVVGARVNVSGQVFEYNGGDAGDTLTEVRNATVTFVSAPAGAPLPIDNVSVPTLLNPAMNEPYEAALVKLRNVKVTGIAPAAQPFQRDMTAGVVTFKADDDILRLTEAVAPIGTCYASIVGIWSYNPFPDTNAWVFLPRGGAGDSVTGGSCN